MRRASHVPVGRVAADASLEKLRQLLTSNAPLEITSTGEIVEVGSTTAGKEKNDAIEWEKPKYIPSSKLAVTQWYENNKELYLTEIEAMRREFNDPNLMPRFLKDGRMYWVVRIKPNLGKDKQGKEYKTMEYTVLLVYDPDHPQARYGTSVKAYLARPTIQELDKLVARIPGIDPDKRYVPHTISDGAGGRYLCSAHYNNLSSSIKEGVASAVSSYRYAYRFLTVFELGIRYPRAWVDFHAHGVF